MKKLFILFILFITLSACGPNMNPNQENADYEQTKKMVVDILQTEDGKKALSEMMQDEKLKQELVIQSDIVQTAIEDVLVSTDGQDMWKSLFDKPDFVKTYAESINEEQMKLMKSLMNDAEYQKQMMELLQNPEVTEQMLSLLKSQQFREHLEETIQQTLETPLFQAKIQEILLQAAENQQKQEESSGGGSEGSSPGGSSDESGSGSGGGGGSEEGGEESS